MDQQQHTFNFNGSGKEFFGIWIVNLLLSIITIGIYSAWAKVRTRKYFAQNTTLADRRFDYHATGKQIFIGRLLFFVGLIAFYILLIVFAALNPLAMLLPFIALFALIPKLLNSSLRFNARMSSWSGIRFDFQGKYWPAFRVFLLYPILLLIAVSLVAFVSILAVSVSSKSASGPGYGFVIAAAFIFLSYCLGTPLLARALREFITNNHRFGVAKFSFSSPIGPFYKALFYSILYSAVVLAIGLSIIGVERFLQAAIAQPQPDELAQYFVSLIPIYIIYFLAFFPAAAVYEAFLRNAVYMHTELEGGHKFVSTISPLKLVWITISNAALTIVTLFLFTPWARVRLAKYLADNTAFIEGHSLDQFVGDQVEKTSALGDAYTDIEAIDIGAVI